MMDLNHLPRWHHGQAAGSLQQKTNPGLVRDPYWERVLPSNRLAALPDSVGIGPVSW